MNDIALRARIVVPCYNEEARLDSAAFHAYLNSRSDIGFVFVNDGSSDGTLDVLRALAELWPARVSCVDQQPNQGKAEAVRVGLIEAIESGAPYVGYFDADLATPLDEIERFVAILEENEDIDIVLGARILLLGRRIERKPIRHYLGRVFATAASLVLNLPVYDTQCGAKVLRSKPRVRALLDEPFASRWIFDVELFARYMSTGGLATGLYEHPLRRWTDVGDSRVKPADFLRAGGEMANIYRTYRLPSDKQLALRVLGSPAVRYAGAGGVGTLAHYATLIVAVKLFAVNPTIGTFAGALVGAGVNYMLNYHLTFASRASHWRTLPRFLVVGALSASLNALGMWLAIQRFGMYWLVAQLCCTAAVLLIGYVLNKAWTFAIVRSPS